MRLAHVDFGGEGTPIVILHALFASSRNWTGVGRFLAELGHAYALDLRNHGRSPRSASHSLEDLAGDLEEWCREHLDSPPVLLGHSMGGLAAMAYALRSPQAVRALLVVDIAPKAYRGAYERELQALRLDISKYASRSRIEEALKDLLPDERVRRFFLTNIEKGPAGFYWMTNGPALEASGFLNGSDYRSLDGLYEGPVLVIAGGESGFVTLDDYPHLFRLFPRAQVRTIPEADHWVHASAPGPFREMVRGFLDGL